MLADQGAPEPGGGGGDAVLATLRQAQQYAHSSDDRVKVMLAAELRSHYLSERARHTARRRQLQQALALAQQQHRAGQASRAADVARLKRLAESNALTQRLTSGRRATAQEALQFSDMMVETAQAAVDAHRRELADVERALADSVARLRQESTAALMACQSILARVPDASATAAAAAAAASGPKISPAKATSPALPPPPPPPPPLPACPPVRASAAPARRIPPPTLPLPLPPRPPDRTASLGRAQPPAARVPYTASRPLSSMPPKPARAPRISGSRLTIEREDQQQSAAVEAQQRRFQAQLPPSLLVALRVRLAASGDDAEEAGHVRQMLFASLRPALCSVLELCLADVGRAELAQGLAGFGADAYLELFCRRTARPLVRVPVTIVGMCFGQPAAGANGVTYPPRLTANQQSIMGAFGAALPAAQTPAAEAAVRRVVQLVAAEPLARNVGVLATPVGLVFVRRTAVQTALISRLHCYTGATAPAHAWWCHPAAALGCFAAELLAAGPVAALEPPTLP